MKTLEKRGCRRWLKLPNSATTGAVAVSVLIVLDRRSHPERSCSSGEETACLERSRRGSRARPAHLPEFAFDLKNCVEGSEPARGATNEVCPTTACGWSQLWSFFPAETGATLAVPIVRLCAGIGG